MQAGFCHNCGEPLVAGAAFCPRCGTKVAAPGLNQPTQIQAPPPPPPGATVQASAPPVGSYTAQYPLPTVLPGPGDPYAVQYPAQQPSGSSPYSQYSQYSPPPGPPPAVTPGGVAPWAQPQKGQGGRNFLKLALILILLLAALGGGLYFLLHKSPTTGTTGGPGATATTGSTPGSGSTPTTGSTPVTSGGGQTLTNINRQAIYAGVMVTITSAQVTASVPGLNVIDPNKDEVLRVQATVNNPSTRAGGVPLSVVAVTPNGQKFSAQNGPNDVLPSILDAQSNVTGSWYYEVTKGTKVADWKIIIGESNELPVTIPFTGSFDSTVWNEAQHLINQTVKFHNGDITGTVLQVVTATWNPGYQAPAGMRFLRVYFAATNNTAVAVNVGDGTPPQYLLIYPDEQRKQPTVVYGSDINDILNGGESKTLGFDTWVIPPGKGHYMLVFLNPPGSATADAGTVDFGTI